MIEVKKSPTADTRTCDWSTVSKETLDQASRLHIGDVKEGLAHLADLLVVAGIHHDYDKITEAGLDAFHADFATGFKQTGWWDNHRKVNRHHINEPDGVPEDVDMVDVLEHIVDCVMAGMARTGDTYMPEVPSEVLQRAFVNTFNKLKAEVKVVDAGS